VTRLFDAKPFIIAEVGSNWRSLEDCLESIRVAKECGSDAVKFQAFDWMALYGVDPVEISPVPDLSVYDHTLTSDRLGQLAAESIRIGIEFMCTAFSPELLKAVDPYVSVHKIASSDAAWPQMLEAVAKTGKPVLLSTGGKTTEEIQTAQAILVANGCPAVLPLVCTAAYPADFVDLALFAHGHVGLSDHTLGYTATVEAARRGAVVIEKHFTAFPDLDSPDRPHSLTPGQFRRMVSIIRYEPAESEEASMYLRHNRRLIATKDVSPGETLQYGVNYGAYRSLEDDIKGLTPLVWGVVEGRAATVQIRRGSGIGPEDFK